MVPAHAHTHTHAHTYMHAHIYIHSTYNVITRAPGRTSAWHKSVSTTEDRKEVDDTDMG